MQIESQNEWRKSQHVIGISPRSRYGEAGLDESWYGAIEMARGRIQPCYAFDGRRIIGITQGMGPYSPHVRYVKFPQRYRTPWSDMERIKEDMLYTTPANYDALIAALAAGQVGRTQWAKTPTTAGIAFNWYDLWPVTGNPAAGAINGTAFTAVQFADTTTGAINHRGNVSTNTKYALTFGAVASANTPWLHLYDRVLAYDQCTYNAAVNQSMTNTLTAQRYNSGAPGLLIMIVTNSTVNGATASNLTVLHYTNQAGTTLQSMPTTTTVTFIPSGAAATATLGARVVAPSTSGQTVAWGYNIPLAQGDTGVQLIANYTTSAANTGTLSMVLMHPISDLVMPVAAIPYERECVYQVAELERIYDGACLALLSMQPATTAYNITGKITYGWSA